MIIKEDVTGNEFQVYGIYWFEDKRLYLIQYNDWWYGLGPIKESNCKIIENSLDDFVFTEYNNGKDFLIHRAAYEDDLYKELIEHTPEAVTEFTRRLAEYK